MRNRLLPLLPLLVLLICYSGVPCRAEKPLPAPTPEMAFPTELTGLWLIRPLPPVGSRELGRLPGEMAYSFGPDGTYRLDAYPPLEEFGRAALLEQNGRRYRVRLSGRLRMNDRQRMVEKWIEVAEDGRSFVLDGKSWEKKT